MLNVVEFWNTSTGVTYYVVMDDKDTTGKMLHYGIFKTEAEAQAMIKQTQQTKD